MQLIQKKKIMMLFKCRYMYSYQRAQMMMMIFLFICKMSPLLYTLTHLMYHIVCCQSSFYLIIYNQKQDSIHIRILFYLMVFFSIVLLLPYVLFDCSYSCHNIYVYLYIFFNNLLLLSLFDNGCFMQQFYSIIGVNQSIVISFLFV